MKPIVLNGKELAAQIEEELKEEVSKLKRDIGEVATLATIIVGNDPSSHIYVKMKRNACERIGIKSLLIELNENATTEEVIKKIEKLNKNKKIDGILLQHPVPQKIDERACFNSIDPNKDVDGVTNINFGKMAMKEEAFASATPLGIMTLLKYYNIEIDGKQTVIIGRSPILGKPLAMMLLNANSTVTIAHSKTKKLPEIIKKADIVAACIGKPKFIKGEWLRKGAVVIDAGYNKGNIGDVDLENYEEILKAYTPVPGGVGPMTISSLLQQTIKSFKSREIRGK